MAVQNAETDTEKSMKSFHRQSLLNVHSAEKLLSQRTAQKIEELVFAVRFVKRSIGDIRLLKIRQQEPIFIVYKNT